ncbi:MAG: diguanylate cyclase [Phycisphaerae bacterium]
MILDTEKITQVGKVLLVAGEQELADHVETILPWTQVVREESLLAALLRMPKENFDLVLVRVPRLAGEMDSALRSFRRVVVAVKIILLTDFFEEPLALKLTQRGLAEDYLILPLHPKELELAVRKCFPQPSVVHVKPAESVPYSRLITPPTESTSPADTQQLLVREVTELINSAELGLKELLERICWSAVFLCKARGAKITVGSDSARVGQEENYDCVMPLTQSGNEIGKLELSTGPGQISCSMVAGYLEQLIPGLIRLASSRGKLQELANTDPLTGLANRRQMQEVIDNLIARAKQERFRVTLVLFDFDDFKHYNDAYGHGAGDEILRESGMLIKRCIRRRDLAARFGGDEFAVVLWDWQERRMPNSEHPRSAMVIMERFRKLLREHYFPRLGPQAQGALTISGGLASYPWDAGSAQDLIERADGALLEAKRSGKDRIYLVGQGPEAVV